MFGRTFDVLRRNALALLVITPALSVVVSTALRLARHAGDPVWGLLPIKILFSLLWLLIGALQASFATLVAVLSHEVGSAGLRESISRARICFAPILAFSFAVEIPDFLDRYLLPGFGRTSKDGSFHQQINNLLIGILPLVILAIWGVCVDAFAAPAEAVIVAEGKGWIEAAVEAMRLTRRSRLRIAFLAASWGLFGLVLTMGWDWMTVVYFSRRDAAHETLAIGLHVLTQTLASIWIVIQTAIYFELPGRTES